MNKFITCLIIFISSYSFSQHRDVPRNIEKDKCYIRYMGENDFSEWREIKCDLLNTYQELSIDLTHTTSGFSNKDSKKIKRKIISLVNKGYTVELRIHHDSQEIDSMNSKISEQKSKVLAGYLDSLHLNPKKIIITALGSSLVKDKCKSKEEDCSKLYAKNSKIEYKVIGLGDDSWYYDSALGNWFKSKN